MKMDFTESDIEAMSQYDQYNRQIFDLIDEIEQSKVLDKILTIPNVVAAGDQTSGKSSVLGKLSGVPLPTGDGTVTLCATQLVLRKSPKSMCRMLAPEIKDIGDVSEICAEINATQKRLINHSSANGGFNFDVMPRIRIENPEARNLTVIDLPGIIHAANSKTQDESVVDSVKDMVSKYVENPKSIILCVIDVTRDLALHKIFQIVRDVDPEGNRTIVVFTKIDKCIADKSRLDLFLEQIGNQDFHSFKHHVFVNSVSESDEEEARFFSSVSKEYGIPMSNCTYKHLYCKVCYMLLKPVLDEFQNSWEKVEEFRNRIIEEKNRLPVFSGDRAAMANDKLTKFIEQSRETMKGHFCENQSSQGIFSVYRDFIHKFKREYAQKMEEMSQKQNINDVVISWRNQEMINFHNWNNFKSYATPIVTSFFNPAVKCHNEIRNFNKEVLIGIVLELFDGQDDHANYLIDKLNQLFEEQEQVLNERLKLVYEYEKYFYCDDELYEELLDKHFHSEVGSKMKKKWSTLKRFVTGNPFIPPAAASTIEVVGNVVESAANGDNVGEAVAEGTSTLTGGLTDGLFGDGSEDLKDEDIKSLVNEFDGFFDGPQKSIDNKHNKNKKMTYEVALEILKKLAMDRISNVVPSNILLTMNHEVQQKLQKIDRYSDEFCQITWQTSKEELRRQELETKENLIRKWRMDFLRIRKQITHL